MIFTKHRFEIWNQTQHPYKHTLGDFSYVNPAAPGVTNVEGAFNWLFAVLYPNTKPPVATPAALPLVGNTLNDYRVVFDDGDGRSASYRWEQREGEASPSWHKIYDMDWGQDSILAAFQNQTQDLYVWKDGRTQLDAAGNPITGLFAGQTIFGGNLASQNLTLRANSGDGVGPHTGYVQVDDNFRPSLDATYNLGTATERFNFGFFADTVQIGDVAISSGLITSGGGGISFDDDTLTTTGDIFGRIITASSQLAVDDSVNLVTLAPGSYTDSTGAVSFGAVALSTTGTLDAGVTTLTLGTDTLVLSPNNGTFAEITSSLGTISFDNENLLTTGSITGGNLVGTRLDIDSLRLDGNTLSITTPNTSLLLSANGTGIVDIQSAMQTLGITTTGTVTITGQLNIDSIRLDGNIIRTLNLNEDLSLQPNGLGRVASSASVVPTFDNTLDLGTSSFAWNDLFLKGTISNGTNDIGVNTLLALRSTLYRDSAQTLPVQHGDALFYDSVSGQWLASAPDSEITHSSLTGLTTGDAGHTQFAMLAGRLGGQTIRGGTAAGETLILGSTSDSTKGTIALEDNLRPLVNASFAGVWTGRDLGTPSHYFRDLYTRGELKGARLENFTSGTLPATSAQNIGRVVYATDNNKAYVDTGTQFKVLGVSKFVQDIVFDGVQLIANVNVSAEVSDARNALWQLRDNINNFEIMAVTILATSASNVRITTNVPLPAGSYRLVGAE